MTTYTTTTRISILRVLFICCTFGFGLMFTSPFVTKSKGK